MSEPLENKTIRCMVRYSDNPDPHKVRGIKILSKAYPGEINGFRYQLLQDKRTCIQDGIAYLRFYLRFSRDIFDRNLIVSTPCRLYHPVEKDAYIDHSWEALGSDRGECCIAAWKIGEELTQPVRCRIRPDHPYFEEAKEVEFSFAVAADDVPLILSISDEWNGGEVSSCSIVKIVG